MQTKYPDGQDAGTRLKVVSPPQGAGVVSRSWPTVCTTRLTVGGRTLHGVHGMPDTRRTSDAEAHCKSKAAGESCVRVSCFQRHGAVPGRNSNCIRQDTDCCNCKDINLARGSDPKSSSRLFVYVSAHSSRQTGVKVMTGVYGTPRRQS